MMKPEPYSVCNLFLGLQTLQSFTRLLLIAREVEIALLSVSHYMWYQKRFTPI